MKNCKCMKTCMRPYGLKSRQSLLSATFKTIRFICMTWMGAGTFCLVTLSMSGRILGLIWRKWPQIRRLRNGGPYASPASSRSITERQVNGGPRCAKSIIKIDADGVDAGGWWPLMSNTKCWRLYAYSLLIRIPKKACSWRHFCVLGAGKGCSQN